MIGATELRRLIRATEVLVSAAAQVTRLGARGWIRRAGLLRE